MTLSFSTDFTITPLAGLFKHEPFSTPRGVCSQAAVISATMLSHSTIAITAYSQVPICTWVEWSKELWRICSVPPCRDWDSNHNVSVYRQVPYPFGHGNPVYWNNFTSNMRKRYNWLE